MPGVEIVPKPPKMGPKPPENPPKTPRNSCGFGLLRPLSVRRPVTLGGLDATGGPDPARPGPLVRLFGGFPSSEEDRNSSPPGPSGRDGRAGAQWGPRTLGTIEKIRPGDPAPRSKRRAGGDDLQAGLISQVRFSPHAAP